MKRDLHLIREILLAVEACESAAQRVTPDSLPGRDGELVAYHLGLAIEAGLVRGHCSGDRKLCLAQSLTWEGHELLDRMRGPALWNAIVRTAREKGLELTVDVVKAIAGKLAMQMLGGE